MPITYVKLNDAGGDPPPPPQLPLQFEAERGPLPASDDLHSVPILLIQLQDELARSRRREALWLSVIVHMVVIAALLFGPKIMPSRQGVILATPADLINNHELTYLEQAPDRQNVPKPPNTNIISDKNRIAMSRTPKLNHDDLKKILDSSRPGAPGPPAPAAPPTPAQPQVAQAAPPAAQQQAAPPPQQQTSQNSLLELQRRQQQQQQANVFANGGAGMSAGSLINQAARATASNRGSMGGGGGGDYGLGINGGGAVQGNMEVLSDTMGVDFGPYLSRVLHDVKQNWYALIPEVARAPLLKRGKVSIEFAITKDGKVAGMRLVGASGDTSLDRAAWGGISASNPFPPLPGEFRGDYLALRFHFFYNPDKNDLR